MIITIRSRKLISGSADLLMQKLDEELVPIISKEPGYIGYYVIDSGDAVVTAISIFEDSPSSEASNKLAECWVQQNLGSMVPEPAEVISGPVVVPTKLI